MIRKPTHIRLIFLAGIAALLFWGCRNQKEIADPVSIPPSFSNSGDAPVEDLWWKSFRDESLNAVVDSALQSNFSLRTAWERLRESNAIADRESSALFPDLEMFASGREDRYSESRENSNQIELGLSSVYEIDLWGRIGSAVDAEQLRAEASLYDYQTAALTLAAEVVRTWYRLADAQNQLSLINEQVETNRNLLELLNNRFEVGQVQSVDVLRQEQLLEATREQKLTAEAEVQALEHQLGLLLGRTPQLGVPSRPEELPDLSDLPETGLPAQLIQKRPDVMRAFTELRAADHDLAAAISNQYPRLSISASASTVSENAGDLFQNWALSAAGNLLAPVFYGGQLRAEADQNEALRNQRFYEYGETILIAFREVEDALIREEKQRESIRSIERQLELADQAYRQLKLRYLNGSGNYLDVLTALDDIQQLRRDHLTARLVLVEYRISLYRSLGGSFETPLMATQ